MWFRNVIFLPLFIGICIGCSNSPYPGEKGDEVVFYASFDQPPRDLDPQRTYTVADSQYLSLCYERLLAYSYLKRPLELEPELAKEVPKPIIKRDATGNIEEVRYSFNLQEGVRFVDDPCFPDGKGREVQADDFIFAFKRLADPKTNCPVVDSFKHISGFSAFRQKLVDLRETHPERGLKELLEEAGEIEGVQKTGPYSLDVVMDHSYPQILYWLAMRFVSAIPQEAVWYYDGKEGRPSFDEHPVGTGPYRIDFSSYNPDAKIVMKRNPTWWGLSHAAPATRYPAEPGEPDDEANGYWSPERAGQPLAQIDRIEWYIERESIPRFRKFLQGYYDNSGVPNESFDYVIKGDDLSDEMKDMGIRLVKDYGLDIFYMGFNMQDDEVGAPVTFSDPEKEKNRDRELERNRKLRQALTLAFDSKEFLRIFNNKLGIPAQSPLPPGMFGYDPEYVNPYCQYDPDLKKARQLLVEAGFPNGIDPATGEALTLTFDVPSSSTQARLIHQWTVDQWKKLGINVELAGTEYNKFQDKMYSGNFQLFRWGWLADYPDPENFLFLLYGPNSGKYNPHNPNHAWYENETYDFYFEKLETMANESTTSWEDETTGETITMSRFELIRKCIDVIEEDAPWIPMFHREKYYLFHDWLTWIKPHPITGGYLKYYDIDKPKRDAARKDWNRPMVWPVLALGGGLFLFFLPAWFIIRKERR